MPKAVLTLVTVLGVSVLAVSLILSRWYVLGSEIDGTPGASTWKVVLEVEGELGAADATVTTVLPPDFRHQHIVNETFESKELSYKVRSAKDGRPRKAVWKRHAGAGQPQSFRLVYSFRCIAGVRRPTAGMNQRTRALDAAPSGGRYTRPQPLVESERPEVAALVARLAPVKENEEDRVRALYQYVADLPAGEAAHALSCLREQAGNDAGKARLLIALCRSQRIPARVVGGVCFAREDDLDGTAGVGQ